MVDALADTLLQVDPETIRNTIANVMTEELIDALSDTHVEVKALLDMLAHRLAEVEVEKPVNTPCAVQVLALVDLLGYILAWKKKGKHNRRDVEINAFVKTLADTLAEVRPTTVGTHYEMWRPKHW